MSVTWQAEWAALSRRISGFLKASEIYLKCLDDDGTDSAHIANQELMPNSRELFKGLEVFLQRHRSTLPQHAIHVLEGFLGRAQGYFSGMHTSDSSLRIKFRLVALASLFPELDFSLADFEVLARRLSEKAFSHLRRSIVADEEIRAKWQMAYQKGETACESLGAVHLLAHGIWAFKAYSLGERTDLVMGDQLVNLAEAERSAEALVLTEWKKVESPAVLETCAEKALRQAEMYGSGSLAGIELGTQRYLVLVSERVLTVPSDRSIGGIIYHYVNVPVDPLSPSRS